MRLVFMMMVLASCQTKTQSEDELRTLLRVPQHLAVPAVPAYNPVTKEKVALGRHLFYDARLSANGTQSCSSCHEQRLGFSDGKRTPVGSTGVSLHRNSQGLANAMYNSTLTWANNGLLELEQQILVPLRNDNPPELGINDGNEREVLSRFESDPLYLKLFAAAFPEAQTSQVTLNKVIFALATFCRTLISGSSAYDRHLAGDETALSDQQKRGLSLFEGERFECFHCHTGANLTIAYRDGDMQPSVVRRPFFNNGLYNVDGKGSYPAYDQGVFDLTFDERDRGHFRPQSLRNVALTAPYMHDGSIATLREVVEHYMQGGRVIEEGPYAGDGRLSPLKSGLVRQFSATQDEVADVLAFLDSLTDTTFIEDPAFGDPFALPTP